MIENVGHISLDKLTKHAELLKESNAPIMPLGPLPKILLKTWII